ncbi:uncharacterized protein LOC126993065 [Eriocheir sinensis]|uniref:uncharacterized protein LOC126993065 n=1 Tax=Eriocheir sinensis TaxID=95602 RepID=UPI0021C6E9D0|nr:uncharacterized protein LOC126993065 [Eriocheir sinensis]XP_050707852.1 uncharacterized protein LOC126993065 [Eriocheir sinensis]
MRRRHGSGRRVTPPCGERPRREPPRMKSAERRHLMRSPSQGDQRQAFMLLEKMRTTLAGAQGKAGCVGLRHKDGHGPSIQGRPSSGRAEASTARVATAAPSTLSLPGQAAHLKTGRVFGGVQVEGPVRRRNHCSRAVLPARQHQHQHHCREKEEKEMCGVCVSGWEGRRHIITPGGITQ